MNQVIGSLVAARLAAGETCVLVVRTGSMAPQLRPGDAVRVAPLPGARPQPGAVLLVRQGDFLVTHRLVGWAAANDELILQGDACPQPDRPTPAAAVLGVVIAQRRGGRWRRLANRRWELAWRRGVLGFSLRRARRFMSAFTTVSRSRYCRTYRRAFKTVSYIFCAAWRETCEVLSIRMKKEQP